MDENDVASGELFSPAHLLLHHLAVMDDELEIEIAHRGAGLALTGRGLTNIAQPPAELEIGALDRVLQKRTVDLLGHCVNECGVALELGEAKRGPQSLHHRVHEIGDDVLRVLELDRREEAGVAGDIGDREIRCLGFGKHGVLQRNRPSVSPTRSLPYRAAQGTANYGPASGKVGTVARTCPASERLGVRAGLLLVWRSP